MKAPHVHIQEPVFSGPRLSRREIQVLRLLCNGRQGKEIAKDLKLAPATIHQYRTQLGAKTGCTTGVQLGVWAVRSGLVDIEVNA